MAQLVVSCLGNESSRALRASCCGRRDSGQRARRTAARYATLPILVSVDTRGDASSSCRHRAPARRRARRWNVCHRDAADPDLIAVVHACGGPRFFTWPPHDETFPPRRRFSTDGRAAAKPRRRQTVLPRRLRVLRRPRAARARRPCRELAAWSWRPQHAIDGDRLPEAGLGEVALFLGMRPR